MFGIFKKRAERELDGILKGARLPAFSKAVLDALRVLRNPESSTDDVVEALQWEPGVVVRVLSTVNSAAYGPRSPIRDVRHAVAYMGRGQLEQLLLAVAVRDTLPSRPAPGFDPVLYWRGSSRRAALARAFAELLHPARSAECFTIGLLGDLAVPVLAHARPDDYGRVLEAWTRDGGQGLDALERDAFGFDHGEVGAMLGSRWELPEPLVVGVGRHHAEEAGDVPPAIRLVARLGNGDGHGVEEMVEEGRTAYGLDPDWMLDALEQAELQARSLVQALA